MYGEFAVRSGFYLYSYFTLTHSLKQDENNKNNNNNGEDKNSNRSLVVYFDDVRTKNKVFLYSHCYWCALFINRELLERHKR